MKIDWDYKESWTRRGGLFMVEITHSICVRHRWCVYAYIYPGHPRFDKFNGTSFWQDATDDLPLHCGATLVEKNIRERGDDDGGDGIEVTSWKVGADYSHSGDESFQEAGYATLVPEVFSDAEVLFQFLSGEAKP